MPVTPDELLAFTEQNVPRDVPSNIRKLALRKNGFGLFLFGIIFTIVGLPLSVAFLPWNLPKDLQLNWNAQTVTGTVKNVTKTSMSENKRKVYEFTFAFTPPGKEKEIEGISYYTGSGPATGSEVQVEYLPDAPSVCRIKGMRLSPFGPAVIFVVIFPIFGLTVLFFSWRVRSRIQHVLRMGEFSVGTISDIRETNVTVNKQSRYEIFVTFDTPTGNTTGSYYAYGEDVTKARQKKDNDEPAGLLYDPQAPKRVLLLDSLLF